VLPVDTSMTRYYIALDLTDKAGVLAAVAAAFAQHDVSIQTMRQDGHGDDATLQIVTHEATEQSLAQTCSTLRGLDSVRQISSVMRVVGE
jgi:homoserine dehydrogenase